MDNMRRRRRMSSRAATAELYSRNFVYLSSTGNLPGIRSALKASKRGNFTRQLIHTAEESTNETALHWACFKGHLPVVQLLLSHSASLEWRDYDGRTPLMHSCLSKENCEDRVEIVRVLVAAGAEVNAEDNDGDTALTFAAERGHVATIKILLESGAAPNPKNKSGGLTALMRAARNGHPKVVELLAKRTGRDELVKTSKAGMTMLMFAAESNRLRTIMRIVKMLQVDVNQTDGRGRSAHYYAIKMGHVDVVEYLFNRVPAKDRPFPIVIRKCLELENSWKHQEILGLVGQYSADMDICNMEMEGRSLMHDLVLQKFLDDNLCRKLKEQMTRKWLDMTPCELAAEKNFSEGVRMMLENQELHSSFFMSQSESPLLKACTHGHADTVRVILEKAVDQNVLHLTDSRGLNALGRLVSLARDAADRVHQRKDILQQLRNWLGWEDFKVLMRNMDGSGRTFLWHACKNGHHEILEFCFQWFDLTGELMRMEEEKQQPSPFWIACHHGHSEVVRLLLKQLKEHLLLGKDKTAPDGTTPLTNALMNGSESVLKELRGLYSPLQVFQMASRFGCQEEVMATAAKFTEMELKMALKEEAVDSDSTGTVGQLVTAVMLKTGVSRVETIEIVAGCYDRDSISQRKLLGIDCQLRNSAMVKMSRKFPVFNGAVMEEERGRRFWEDMEVKGGVKEWGGKMEIDLNRVDKYILKKFCCLRGRNRKKKGEERLVISQEMNLRICHHIDQRRDDCEIVRSLLLTLQLLQGDLQSNSSDLMRQLKPEFRLTGSIAEETLVGDINDIDVSVRFLGLEDSSFSIGNHASDLHFNSKSAIELLKDFLKDKKFDYPKFLHHFLKSINLSLSHIQTDLPNGLTTRHLHFEPCAICVHLSQKNSDSVYQPFTHCAECVPAVTHTKAGACINLVWNGNVAVSVDLVPFLPVVAVPAVDLYSKVTQTLLDLRPPFWLDYYHSLHKQDQILAEELTLQQQENNISMVTVKLVHYGEKCNHMVRPAQQMSMGRLLKGDKLKKLYCLTKVIKGLTSSDLKNMQVKRVLLTSDFLLLSETGSRNDYELLYELLSHPDLKRGFGGKVDFDKWKYNLDEHARKEDVYAFVPL